MAFAVEKEKVKEKGVEVGCGRESLVIGKVKEKGERVKEKARVRFRVWECDRGKNERKIDRKC